MQNVRYFLQFHVDAPIFILSKTHMYYNITTVLLLLIFLMVIINNYLSNFEKHNNREINAVN